MQVPVSHHQYVLLDTDAEAPFEDIDDRRAGSGLVSVNAQGTYASVKTGTPHGDLDVTFDIQPAEAQADFEGWDEVVEVSLHFSGDGPLAGDPVSDDYVNVPLLGEEDDFQWWRFRIHARGRDTAHDPSTPPEQHLIQIWPAPRAPEIRHKLTDQTGHRRRDPDPDYYARAKAAEAAAGNLPEGAAYTSQRVTPLVASLEEEDQRP
ncbi:hypothetical protein [Streptomyces flavofungini]|uniref:hypothetical protein n=1 Tax=Streptomyces flavofungini TaxID=68200 RepID=UPI0025AF78BB|nr:hypothetical protein [Streptomyces flavofungini]WJV51762.1 hypothetical protein QUY26_39735 [Streptomyces flavofungini]